jgi:hypothetical protein
MNEIEKYFRFYRAKSIGRTVTGIKIKHRRSNPSTAKLHFLE